MTEFDNLNGLLCGVSLMLGGVFLNVFMIRMTAVNLAVDVTGKRNGCCVDQNVAAKSQKDIDLSRL